MGTYGYISPEQLLGQGVDERTDAYVIGVIALETVGRPIAHTGTCFHDGPPAAFSSRA